MAYDERTKENIHDANIDIIYENVKQIQLVNYNHNKTWSEHINKEYITTSQLGVISQQIEQINPDWVKDFSREVRIFDAIPSGAFRNSLKVLRPINRSRTMIRDHRSPIKSRTLVIGHPERCIFDNLFPVKFKNS